MTLQTVATNNAAAAHFLHEYSDPTTRQRVPSDADHYPEHYLEWPRVLAH